MASFDWRSRGKAALVHLAGSALIACGAAALVFLLWYPWPHSSLAGGSGLFVLIAAVDVVMGPLITFAIFDRRKPGSELQRDLLVVVVLQLAALGYGIVTMYQARPVALALEPARLRVVTANAVQIQELAQAPARLQKLSLTGPILIRTEPPTDPGEMVESIEMAMAGADLGTRPKFWRSWDQTARSETKKEAKPLAALRQRYPQRADELNAAIAKAGRTEQQLGYLPIVSRFADWVALIDLSTGDIVGYAPFDGF